MKVLSIGRFYPASFGGIERHIELLHDNLVDRVKIDTIVVNKNLKSELLTINQRQIYKVPCLGVVASTPLCPTLPQLVRQLCRVNHYDIAHLHFPNPMAHL